MTPACDRHRELVDRVLEGAPTDEDLAAYAERVPTCPECRQALMVANNVHPSVLDQGGADSAAAAWAQTRDRPMERLAEELERPGPSRIPLVAVAAVALAAIALLSVRPRPEPPPPPAPAPVVAAAPTPPPPPEPAPETPRTPAPPTPEPTDAVVDAADWDPPAWQDLRGSTPKGIAPATSIDFARIDRAPTVGGTWALTAITSAPTPVTLCVRGPETGVVWRGHLPAGRTPLTQAGSPAGFAFSEPGTHRFVATLADDPTCSDPAWILQMEVRR